jgi:hypothetical protein
VTQISVRERLAQKKKPPERGGFDWKVVGLA